MVITSSQKRTLRFRVFEATELIAQQPGEIANQQRKQHLYIPLTHRKILLK